MPLMETGCGPGGGPGVLVGRGVGGMGVAVGYTMGTTVLVGRGVSVGTGVSVDTGVSVGTSVGMGVAEGSKTTWAMVAVGNRVGTAVVAAAMEVGGKGVVVGGWAAIFVVP